MHHAVTGLDIPTFPRTMLDLMIHLLFSSTQHVYVDFFPKETSCHGTIENAYCGSGDLQKDSKKVYLKRKHIDHKHKESA